MNHVTAAQLAAWIRFVPRRDGYGVPLFSTGGNHLLIPTTDSQLRILSFSEFYNEDNFSISYDLPTRSLRIFKIDDMVPIPFIIDERCDVIESNIELDELNRQLGTRSRTSTASLLREVIFRAKKHRFDDLFVGRIEELRKLFSIWERVKEEMGFECVVLSGPAGIGKTALVMQFRRMLERSGVARHPFIEINYDQAQVFDLPTGRGPAVIIYLRIEKQPPDFDLEGLLDRVSGRWGMLILEIRGYNPVNTYKVEHKVTTIELNLLSQAEIADFVKQLSLPEELVLPFLQQRSHMRFGNPLQLQLAIEDAVRSGHA